MILRSDISLHLGHARAQRRRKGSKALTDERLQAMVRVKDVRNGTKPLQAQEICIGAGEQVAYRWLLGLHEGEDVGKRRRKSLGCKGSGGSGRRCLTWRRVC